MRALAVSFDALGGFNRALFGLVPGLLLALGSMAQGHAQGTIVFNNLANNNASMYAQSGGLFYLYDPPNAPWPTGWGLLNKDLNFNLQAGPSADFDNSLRPIHTWLISDGSASGIAVGGGRIADPSGGVYSIPGVTPGAAAYIQIKAWTGAYDTWEGAVAAGEGYYAIRFWNRTGGAGSPAASLVDMPSFNMGPMEIIPEPSSLALFSLGAIALLAWGHRQV